MHHRVVVPKTVERSLNHTAYTHDSLYLFGMTRHIATLNGIDIYYSEGAFHCDPLPSLTDLQSIVSYLFSEGFIDEEIY